MHLVVSFSVSPASLVVASVGPALCPAACVLLVLLILAAAHPLLRAAGFMDASWECHLPCSSLRRGSQKQPLGIRASNWACLHKDVSAGLHGEGRMQGCLCEQAGRPSRRAAQRRCSPAVCSILRTTQSRGCTCCSRRAPGRCIVTQNASSPGPGIHLLRRLLCSSSAAGLPMPMGAQ